MKIGTDYRDKYLQEVTMKLWKFKMIENKRGHRSFPFTYFWLEISPDQVLGSVGNRKVYFIVNYCKFLCIQYSHFFFALHSKLYQARK